MKTFLILERIHAERKKGENDQLVQSPIFAVESQAQVRASAVN